MVRHHVVKSGNDVIVRLSAWISEAELVAFPVFDKLRVLCFDLLFRPAIVDSSIDLVQVSIGSSSHLVPWLSLVWAFDNRVRNVSGSLNCAIQGRCPESRWCLPSAMQIALNKHKRCQAFPCQLHNLINT